MHLQPRILSCLLLLLLGVLWPSLVVVAQQPATVNLRPRVIGTEAGVPEVQVTVDKKRVPLGTAVTFTLTPSSVINNSKYVVTLRFGDRQQHIVRTSEVSHLYLATGTYTYSVLVKPSGSNGGDKSRCSSAVTLSAAPARISQGQAVSFTAQPSPGCPNIQYRFFYGDGGSSSWQNSPRSDHEYNAAGVYRAYVDIGEAGRQFGGSARKVIEVAKVPPLTVSLAASPASVKRRQPVSFFATASPANVNTKYRFAFGDSRSTAWQNSSQTKHVYNAAGNYRAYVEVAQLGSSATAISMPAVVGVQTSPSPAPTRRPSPSPAPPSTPTPSPSPDVSPPPNNGSSPSPAPTSSSPPLTTTSPSPNGSDSPGGSPSPGDRGTPQNGGAGTSSSSPGAATTSNELADASDSSKRWWIYVLVAALILFLLYQATAILFTPQPTFAAFSDPGMSALANNVRDVPIDFQLVLNSNVSSGAYAFETDEPTLVRNADRLEERQVIEI